MLTQQAMGWNRKKTEPPQSLGSQIYQSKGILQWSSCLTQQQTADLEPGHPQKAHSSINLYTLIIS